MSIDERMTAYRFDTHPADPVWEQRRKQYDYASRQLAHRGPDGTDELNRKARALLQHTIDALSPSSLFLAERVVPGPVSRWADAWIRGR